MLDLLRRDVAERFDLIAPAALSAITATPTV